MISYIKKLFATTILYIIYLINYIHIRETEQWLYSGNFFDYEFKITSIFTSYFFIVPFIAFILYKSNSHIFSLLSSLLLITGVLPGVIMYAFSSNESLVYFYIFYVYFIFILCLFYRPRININRRLDIKKKSVINIKVVRIFAYVGFYFFIYCFVKYFNIIQFRSINEVYIQRFLFADLVSSWEVYIIVFAKNISTFSFLILAIHFRKKYYLFPIIFIYIIDYGLAAHKGSLVLLFFIILYYFIYNKINTKYYYELIIFVIGIYSLCLQFSILFSLTLKDNLLAIYDRVFHVTAGLFARYYEFSNDNYFFYGGNGLLGKIFSGVNENYAFIIGKEYFSEGVRSNADFITDGYVNFGIFGSLCSTLILWSFFNKNDDNLLKEHFKFMLPLVLIYSMVLSSMGLQTTLLTGGLVFFILLIKFGFKEMYEKS